MNFWQGKNIRLRGIEPADGDTFFAWDLDSETARNLEFVWPPVSIAQTRKWAEEQSQKKLENDEFIWVIEDANGRPVGSIRTHHCNSRNGTFSYGLNIATEHQRKGYAAEAVGIVLKYYFQELRYQKVTVDVHANNEASARLHERLGFKLEGTHRRMFFSSGKFHDLFFYGMTKEEWSETI